MKSLQFNGCEELEGDLAQLQIMLPVTMKEVDVRGTKVTSSKGLLMCKVDVPNIYQEELPPGVCTVTCLTCNFDCYENWNGTDDAEKKYCPAMDSDGNCQQCPRKCSWDLHKAVPYVIKSEMVKAWHYLKQ